MSTCYAVTLETQITDSSKLDRQIKRLDIQIKGLESAGILPPDALLPSLLHPSPGNRVPPLSATTTGASTPLQAIPGNASALPPNPISNAALARLATHQIPHSSSRIHSPILSGTTTPTAATPTSVLVRSARESSLDAKRRRLTNQPVASSSLRQSSLGPGPGPKTSTPTTTTAARAGSAGPRSATTKKPIKIGGSLTLPGRPSGLNPAAAKKGGRRKGQRKGGLAGLKPSPSDGDESALSETGDSGSERTGLGALRGGRAVAAVAVDGDVEMGGMEDEEDDGGDGDDKKYCTCRSVSYGNMVACDNDECEFEWFHWSCVGVIKEPVGKWYCEACKVKLGIK